MSGLSRRSSLRLGLAGLGLLALRPDRASALERIKVRELYGRGGAFSDKAKRLDGEEIEISGFMAPPLKPDAAFFVLTKMPMAVCPFCDNEADWPRDIVLVRLRDRQDWVAFNRPIVVTGRLELGTEVDEETGFVSRVRLTDAEYELA